MVSNIKFQFYPANIFSKSPLGEITLQQLVNSIKNPKEDIKKLFLEIEEAGKVGNKELKNQLKEKLFFFIPSAVTDGQARGYDNIVKFNPLAVVEYDNLVLDEANYLKYKIFNEFPSCCASFLSPSKTGVKFIFHIREATSVEDYKSLYFGLVYFLEQIKEGVDLSNERITQPLFFSWDDQLLFRENPEIWTKRGAKENTLKYDADLDGYECDEEITKQEINFVWGRLKKMLDKVEDDGHNNLIKICSLAGGYVAGWGFPEEIMTNLIHTEIENHPYYRKGIEGYKKTATRFIKSGQRIPIIKEVRNG